MDKDEKLIMLKKMRFIATGLLILMTCIYFVFKKFESQSFLISCIVAFSEASMVGALADWFAVTALFKHPLGMSWIPHTAIIQKNKDRLGESLSYFVVTNFFTRDIVKSKLDNIDFSQKILQYIDNNKAELSSKAVQYYPSALNTIYNSKEITAPVIGYLREKAGNTDISPIAVKTIEHLVDAGVHVPVTKQLIQAIYGWVNENKEKTIKIIEGMNIAFVIPFVGDMTYKFILKSLEKVSDAMENDSSSDLSSKLLQELPGKIISDIKNSENFSLQINKLKNDLLNSEKLNELVCEKLEDFKNRIISYSSDSPEETSMKIQDLISSLIDMLSRDEAMMKKVDYWVKDAAANLVDTYRHEIGKLISDTVKSWPEKDMVDNLELQVGGDLQYIRINGTIVGGLVGLLIHIISYLF